MRCFVDSSVLFAACYSSTGASRRLLEYALDDEIALVISDVVLAETETNLARKAPRALSLFKELIDLIRFERIHATGLDVALAAQYAETKDAPIVAAAQAAKVDFLVTLDRTHLIAPPVVASLSGL